MQLIFFLSIINVLMWGCYNLYLVLSKQTGPRKRGQLLCGLGA